MRKLNTFGAVLLAAFALVALTASGAMAKTKTGLVLTEEGVPVANGGPAYAGFESEGCLVRSAGTLTTNDSSKDKASFTSIQRDGCTEEAAASSISGFVTSAELTTAGTASYKATISVTDPGPCVYAIKKFAVPLETSGGEVFEHGTVTGKLGKGSSKSCAKTHVLSFYVSVTNEASEPFLTEL
jgi:hypothetical protein